MDRSLYRCRRGRQRGLRVSRQRLRSAQKCGTPAIWKKAQAATGDCSKRLNLTITTKTIMGSPVWLPYSCTIACTVTRNVFGVPPGAAKATEYDDACPG